MKIKIIIVIVFFGLVQFLLSYPITPRPLRKLVIESEYIVYASVVDVSPECSWNNAKALLVIDEILQGNLQKDTIEVFFDAGLICPAPPSYEKGTNVLAFLDKQEFGFSTHALSYGSKTINNLSFKAYKKRILELQNILKINDQNRKIAQTIDWLVSCAVDSNTRWEGLYELSPFSDFMSFYDDDIETNIKKYELSNSQKLKLREALFKIDYLNYSDLGLIDLVVKDDDTEIISFLIQELKETNFKNMWFVGSLMDRIAEYTDREDLLSIVQEFDKLELRDKNRDEKVKHLAKKFIEKF